MNSPQSQQSKRVVDYLILGAGPAGLQLGYYLHRKNRDYLILEAGKSPGTFFKHYPRHRSLLSINKRYTGFDDPEVNLRWDWNSLLTDDHELRFTEYSDKYFPNADDYVRYLCDFNNQFCLNTKFSCQVVHIARDGEFRVACEDGAQFHARRLIVATGRAKPYVPPIHGIEHCEWYADVSIDPMDYQGQRVMVIGKGNSGLEMATSLIGTTAIIHLISPHPVRLAWRTHYVGDLRAVNNEFLDTYQLKSQNTILDADIERIERLPDGQFRVDIHYSHADDHRDSILVDRLIACTGFQFDDSIFDPVTCALEISPCGGFALMNCCWEATRVPDLYFAGALMHVRDYRKSFSGFIHGFRYNVRFLHRLLEKKYEGQPLEFQTFEFSSAAVVGAIIHRVMSCSSLFQQPEFLCDVLLLDTTERRVICYYDVPRDYVQEGEEFVDKPRLIVTMEYGDLAKEADPFNIFRFHTDGSRSAFIHPVIRFCDRYQNVREYHIPEDLENQWDREFYTRPLAEFIAEIIQAEVREHVHASSNVDR